MQSPDQAPTSIARSTASAIVLGLALGSVTVAGAVLFYLLDTQRAARPLDAIKQFMSDNNAVIMMVALLRLGAKSSATASPSSESVR